jgi:hypothetical protein
MSGASGHRGGSRDASARSRGCRLIVIFEQTPGLGADPGLPAASARGIVAQDSFTLGRTGRVEVNGRAALIRRAALIGKPSWWQKLGAAAWFHQRTAWRGCSRRASAPGVDRRVSIAGLPGRAHAVRHVLHRQRSARDHLDGRHHGGNLLPRRAARTSACGGPGSDRAGAGRGGAVQGARWAGRGSDRAGAGRGGAVQSGPGARPGVGQGAARRGRGRGSDRAGGAGPDGRGPDQARARGSVWARARSRVGGAVWSGPGAVGLTGEVRRDPARSSETQRDPAKWSRREWLSRFSWVCLVMAAAGAPAPAAAVECARLVRGLFSGLRRERQKG